MREMTCVSPCYGRLGAGADFCHVSTGYFYCTSFWLLFIATRIFSMRWVILYAIILVVCQTSTHFVGGEVVEPLLFSSIFCVIFFF
jgi:hypothetical protein